VFDAGVDGVSGGDPQIPANGAGPNINVPFPHSHSDLFGACGHYSGSALPHNDGDSACGVYINLTLSDTDVQIGHSRGPDLTKTKVDLNAHSWRNVNLDIHRTQYGRMTSGDEL
jgi:hypothetical protein